MKSRHNLVLILLSVLLLVSSCEKIIVLDLNDSDREYVVEGKISNVAEYNYIKISKSDNFYETEDFEDVSGAVVTITDASGVQTLFSEVANGFYSNPLFTANAYEKYELNIEINGETITASAYVPGISAIDSIPYQKNQGGFFGEGYTAFVYWLDEVNEKNYYKLNNYAKGLTELSYTPDDAIFVTEDRLFNGIGTGTPIFSRSFELGDTVIVDLMEIDEPCYKYWYTLSQVATGQTAAPGNPESNLSGGTLGYFGGYNVFRDTIVIE